MRTAMVVPFVLALAVFTPAIAVAQTRTSSPSANPSTGLNIYVIDVEGGNSTLFVTPSRESLLIDTGNAGAAAARDAGRIIDPIKDAGLQQIDPLIITHCPADPFRVSPPSA